MYNKEYEQVRGTGIQQVPDMPSNVCYPAKIFNEYKPTDYKLLGSSQSFGDRTCTIDYINQGMVEDLEAEIDCSQRCMDKIYDFDDPDGEEAQQAADECEENCHHMIKEYSKGSFTVRETGEVVEANMPFTMRPFATESEYGESMLAEGWEQKVTEQFADLGCRPDPDVGFRHPHEFAETTAGTEPDEDPAAFALHIRGGGKGQCMLEEVLELVRKLEGEKTVAKTQEDFDERNESTMDRYLFAEPEL